MPMRGARSEMGIGVRAVAASIVLTTATATAGNGPAPAGPACVVGKHPPELAAWAAYVAKRVCDASKGKDPATGRPFSSGAPVSSALVVTLDHLSPAYSVLVTYEEPLGVTRRMLWASASSLLRAASLAHRFARDLSSPWSPDDLVPNDQAAPVEPQRHFEHVLFGFGGGALVFPKTDTNPFALSGKLSLEFAMPPASVIMAGILGSTWPVPQSLLAEVSLGGRYYLLARNATPFFGAGPAYLYFFEATGHDVNVSYCGGFAESPCRVVGHVAGQGAAAYAEAGIVFGYFRKTSSRLALRLDIPFFTLHRDLGADYEVSSGSTSRYDTPITLMYDLAF